MGGSGAIGDIFEAILSKTNIHVTLVSYLTKYCYFQMIYLLPAYQVILKHFIYFCYHFDAKVIEFSVEENEKICIKNIEYIF